MAHFLGQLIKDLRESNGMSQKELAQGICSQSEISKIEAGKNMPYTDIMIQIAIKLGVDLNYFFYRIDKPEPDFINDRFIEIRKAVREKDYYLVEGQLKKLDNHPLFRNYREKQFLLWHHGIIQYYLYKNTELSFHFLNKALAMRRTAAYTEQEIEIINSLGAIYCEVSMCSEGIKVLEEALEVFNKLSYVANETIYTRILYNLAKSHYLIGGYQESKNYCNMGIKYCLDIESSYLFGELLYLLGQAFKKLNEFEEAFIVLQRARALFEIQNKSHFIEKADEQLQEIKI